MPKPWRLESYDDAAAPPQSPSRQLTPAAPAPTPAPAAGAPDLEEERLAAFDRGYKAGWDDATAAHEADQGRIAADLAHNLQAMSFTYYEARTALMSELESLLRGIVHAVLPAARHPALCTMLLDRLETAARGTAEVAAEIVVAPVNRAKVEALVEGRVAPPLRVTEEPSLSDGQAFLRFGDAEEKIDLDAVLAEIAQAITEFFAHESAEAEPEEEKRHAG